jgi:hypothetical protein
MRVRSTVATALMLLAAALQCGAQKTPLPSFHVTTLEASEKSSGSLTLEGQWIFVYVQTNCRPCNQALTHLKIATMAPAYGDTTTGNPIDLAHTLVIVVSGDDLPAAKELAANFPWLKTANWYVDASHEATKALSLHGAPLFFGMEGSVIQWKFSGLTANPGAFNETLLKWMRANPASTDPLIQAARPSRPARK